jgi:hypothetical protein
MVKTMMSSQTEPTNKQDIFSLRTQLIEHGEDPNLVQWLISVFDVTKNQTLDTEEEWNEFIATWEQA